MAVFRAARHEGPVGMLYHLIVFENKVCHSTNTAFPITHTIFPCHTWNCAGHCKSARGLLGVFTALQPAQASHHVPPSVLVHAGGGSLPTIQCTGHFEGDACIICKLTPPTKGCTTSGTGWNSVHTVLMQGRQSRTGCPSPLH